MNRRGFLGGMLAAIGAAIMGPIKGDALAAPIAKAAYKGKQAFDAGFFYCPYIPVQFMKPKITTWVDPFTHMVKRRTGHHPPYENVFCFVNGKNDDVHFVNGKHEYEATKTLLDTKPRGMTLEWRERWSEMRLADSTPDPNLSPVENYAAYITKRANNSRIERKKFIAGA